MGTVFVQFSFSSLVTATFAITTNASRRSLICYGLSGTSGWMIYWVYVQIGRSAAFGSLFGSLEAALINDLFSKRLKVPVTVFNIPGMVPLIPSGLAHQAVRDLVTESHREAAHYAVQAVTIAEAIALDLILPEVSDHNTRSFKIKRDTIVMGRKKRLFK